MVVDDRAGSSHSCVHQRAVLGIVGALSLPFPVAVIDVDAGVLQSSPMELAAPGQTSKFILDARSESWPEFQCLGGVVVPVPAVCLGVEFGDVVGNLMSWGHVESTDLAFGSVLKVDTAKLHS